MDGPEVMAMVAAGIGGWALGRQRQQPTSPAALDDRGQAIGERVERGGREMADHLGAAVGTGGLKAAVLAAKGVRSAGNVLATGAGKSVAALDGARSTVGSAVARARHSGGHRADEDQADTDDLLSPGDVALATKSDADLIATVDLAPDHGAEGVDTAAPADGAPDDSA
jgi:hypothetical protein